MQARLGAELNARLLSDSELSLSDYAVLVHPYLYCIIARIFLYDFLIIILLA